MTGKVVLVALLSFFTSWQLVKLNGGGLELVGVVVMGYIFSLVGSVSLPLWL